MHIAAMLVQDDAKALWDFKVGTQWTYTESDSGTKKTTVMVVKEKKDSKVYIESKETPEGEKESVTKTMYMGFDAKLGVVVWGERKDDKDEDQMHWWKPGAKEWETPKCVIEIPAPDMETPGGKIEYWVAEGVGMIKMSSKMGENEFQLELKEFAAK
jgi:hypothetical protein